MAQKQYPQQLIDALAKVDNIADGLGKPVDPGIKLLVGVLHCHNFVTTSSCEGHVDWGEGPYVHIETSVALDAYEKITELELGSPEWLVERDKANEAGLRERVRLFAFLQEFYTGRKTPYTLILVVEPLAFGRSNLTCQGVTTIRLTDEKTRKRWQLAAWREMKDFADFLIDKL